MTKWGPSSSTTHQGLHVYDTSLAYDKSTLGEVVDEVSPINIFLKMYLELMKDELTLDRLHRLIEQCMQEKEVPTMYTPNAPLNR